MAVERADSTAQSWAALMAERLAAPTVVATVARTVVGKAEKWVDWSADVLAVQWAVLSADLSAQK